MTTMRRTYWLPRFVSAACGSGSTVTSEGRVVAGPVCTETALAWANPASTGDVCSAPWQYQVANAPTCYAVSPSISCPVSYYPTGHQCWAPQREARRLLGAAYKVERWGYDWVGRVGGHLGFGAAEATADATKKEQP